MVDMDMVDIVDMDMVDMDMDMDMVASKDKCLVGQFGIVDSLTLSTI